MRSLMFVAGLSVLSFGFVFATSAADSAPPEDQIDGMLDLALKSPQSFMFTEHVLSTIGDSNKDLVVTSARGLNRNPDSVFIRPGTMRIFRANAEHDDFTRQGGWHWRCGDVEGSSQFKQPGAVIMVVRHLDGTVHWYALAFDLRC